MWSIGGENEEICLWYGLLMVSMYFFVLSKLIEKYLGISVGGKYLYICSCC